MLTKDRQIRFKDGESISFEILFKEYFSKFYAFTTRFVEDTYICEDIVQETFIAVWESQQQEYDSLLMLHAFIYRTVRNKALNYLKHHKVREQYARKYLQELESESYLFSAVLDEEYHHTLYKAIRKLTLQCQTVIRLHLAGKSNQEIAEEMGISVVTVKSHKMVAYKELRKMLQFVIPLLLCILTKKSKKNQF